VPVIWVTVNPVSGPEPIAICDDGSWGITVIQTAIPDRVFTPAATFLSVRISPHVFILSNWQITATVFLYSTFYGLYENHHTTHAFRAGEAQ